MLVYLENAYSRSIFGVSG